MWRTRRSTRLHRWPVSQMRRPATVSRSTSTVRTGPRSITPERTERPNTADRRRTRRSAPPPEETIMTDLYTLPDLPYDPGALEPHISARIMELHHDKHHAAYVKGANTALEKLQDMRGAGDFATLALLERNLAFHVSGHVLHSIFWTNLSPDGGGEPAGLL